MDRSLQLYLSWFSHPLQLLPLVKFFPYFKVFEIFSDNISLT